MGHGGVTGENNAVQKEHNRCFRVLGLLLGEKSKERPEMKRKKE